MRFTIGNLPGVGWSAPTERIVDVVSLAESAGFDRVSIEDNRRHHDPWVVMTACLVATTRLGIECLVTDPFTRHPLLTARAFATMSDLSGGRVILGWGGGGEQPAYWHEQREHPMQAIREATEICRRLWSGGTVTYEGSVIKLYDGKLDFAPVAPIPVLIAARGRGMLRLAGEIADIVHLASLFVDADHHRDNIALVSAGASSAGRRPGDFEIDLSVPVSISRDRNGARRAAKRIAAQGILWTAGADRYARQRTDWQRPRQFDVPLWLVEEIAARWDMWTQPALPEDVAALIDDDVLDRFAVAGEPAECADRLAALADSLPEVTGFRFKLPPAVGASSLGLYADTISAMAQIIPALRDRSRRQVQAV